jgi:hypothetical protein
MCMGEITGLFSHAVLSPEYLPRRRLAQSLLALAMLPALLLLLDRSCGLQLIRQGSSRFQLLIDRLVECGGADNIGRIGLCGCGFWRHLLRTVAEPQMLRA